MRKIFATLFAALAMTAMAQNVELSKSSIDFGTIPMKPKSVQTVMLYNKTAKPVVITAVNVDCNCTKVEWTKKPIMAGDSTQLKVVYTPVDAGVFYKKVRVLTSDGEKVLTVRGKVE